MIMRYHTRAFEKALPVRAFVCVLETSVNPGRKQIGQKSALVNVALVGKHSCGTLGRLRGFERKQ